MADKKPKRKITKGFTFYLAPLLEELEKRKGDGELNKTSVKTAERLTALLRRCLNTYIAKLNEKATKDITTALKRQYNIYSTNGFTSNNKGLKGWRLNQLKKPLREEMKNRILFSLNLIKNRNGEFTPKVENRFLNWIEDKRRNIPTKALLPSLKLGDEIAKAKRHNNFVLADQTRKMIGNFDAVVAEHYDAIAFEWKTRRDNRVVGNPSGKYPDVQNPHIHGDHYERSNKIFFLHNSWAIKKRLINTSAKNFRWADFEDGMPGQPIGCRCYARYFYDLEDIDEELLTKRGKEYIKNGEF